MKYKAIIIDIDGTLLNTLSDIADAMNMVLANEGFPIHDPEEYKLFMGDSAFDLVSRALPLHIKDKDIITQFTETFIEVHNRLIISKTHPYPGIPELLDNLNARGIKLCIFTNKPDPVARLIVDKLLPEWKFSAILGVREDIPKKPDPKGALTIAESLGIDHSSFIFLGDSGVDMV